MMPWIDLHNFPDAVFGITQKLLNIKKLNRKNKLNVFKAFW